MEIRNVKFNEDVQKGLLKGAEIVFRAVASTMGAKGRYVAIQDRFHTHKTTKDGYLTSQTIFLEDEAENMGAQMIKEVAKKSADFAGDGTTTSTVLAYYIYLLATKAISSGCHAIDVKKGIQIAVDKTVELIAERSIPVDGNLEILKRVATVSANNNEEIGQLIIDAYSEININGLIKVEEAIWDESTVEVVDGMRIPAGFVSPAFINHSKRSVCELKETFICLYDGTISTFAQLEKILTFMGSNSEKSLLIIAMGIEQEALQTLIINKQRAGLKVCAVPVPGHGATRDTLLKDIEAATGAIIISEAAGYTMKEFHENFLGSAKSVVISERECEIVEASFDPDLLKERIAMIEDAVENEKLPASVEFHKNRLALIHGGVAIIHAGATTTVELNEKRDLIEDAIAATKSAAEEGILPGGGSALYHISKLIEKVRGNSRGEQEGIKVVAEALKMPLRTIMSNASIDLKSLEENINTSNNNRGYDLNQEKYCDMIEAGILDTAKVERMAIENSSSVASMMLMTNTLVYTENPE